MDSVQQLFPIAVLDQRVITTGNSSIHQLLIHWSELPPALATWEENLDVHRRFPDAPAWGQAGSHDLWAGKHSKWLSLGSSWQGDSAAHGLVSGLRAEYRAGIRTQLL